MVFSRWLMLLADIVRAALVCALGALSGRFEDL